MRGTDTFPGVYAWCLFPSDLRAVRDGEKKANLPMKFNAQHARYQPQWAVERRRLLVDAVIVQDKVCCGTMRIGCPPNVSSQSPTP